MNEEKKVPFKWEYGEETISLQLGMYANNQRLYIGMITHTEDRAEPFADMTVNLPGYSLDPGEAFISGDISKDLLRFIKENKLGKVLPYQVQSGYGKYSAVAFDLEKLKAFDPILPSVLNCWELSVCPMMRSKRTPVPRWYRTSSSSKRGTDRWTSCRNGRRPDRRRTGLPSTGILSTTRKWCWADRSR